MSLNSTRMSDADLQLLHPGKTLEEARKLGAFDPNRGGRAQHQGNLLKNFFRAPKVVKEKGPDCVSRTAKWNKNQHHTTAANSVFKLGEI